MGRLDSRLSALERANDADQPANTPVIIVHLCAPGLDGPVITGAIVPTKNGPLIGGATCVDRNEGETLEAFDLRCQAILDSQPRASSGVH